MTHTTLARLFVHRLACDVAKDDCVLETEGRTFDPAAYSRMKYGDAVATRQFAESLAQVLTTEQPEVLRDTIPTDFLVAYKAVPPACYYLSRYCLDRINEIRAASGLEPGRLLPVYKNRVAAGNYAAAPLSARQQELDAIAFTLEGRSLLGKSCVLIDDARITGAAERKILEVLMPARPCRLTLLYLASFQEDVRPEVEDMLNRAAVRNLADIAAFIRADAFDLNIRTLKRILSAPPKERADFLAECPARMLEKFLRGALQTGVEFTSRHVSGIEALRAAWREKRKAEHAH